jgi:hypothetical protein
MITTKNWVIHPSNIDPDICEVALTTLLGERKSFTFKHRAVRISSELRRYARAVEKGTAGLIQNELPFLSSSEREFLMSGITSEEWDDMFYKDSE